MKIYVYSEEGVLEEVFDTKDRKLSHSIKNAIYGTKGYGWVNGKYYSNQPAIIMSREQEREYFDIWLSANYQLLWDKYEVRGNFDPDVFNDTILYMYREIAKPRGINNYFNQFNWKLKRMKIDAYRKESTRRNSEGSNIVTDEFDYIQDVGSELLVDEEYNCIDDINSLILSRAVTEYVYNKYKEEGYVFVDYYVNYITSKKKGGQKALAEHYNLPLIKVHTLLKEIKEDIENNRDIIFDLYELSKFKELDDYTLNEIINY